MKLLNTYKQILLEASGISTQARAWSKIITDLTKNTNEKKLVIDGKNYPDVYESFPVDIFYVSDGTHGEYDELKSGYDKDGKYVVYLKIPLNKGILGFNSSNSDVESTLNHELRHAFEDYNRISKGFTPISKTKEIQQFYNKDFEKVIKGELKHKYEPFKSILYSLYLTSKVEESGFSETVVDTNIPIIQMLKDILNHQYFDSKELSDDDLMTKKWNSLKKEVSIPILDKFDNYLMFVSNADKIIQRRALKMYKKLQKAKYLNQDINKKG